jgi:DNA-binding response OmpR family regulator
MASVGLAGRLILVVEDEAREAVNIAKAFENAGARVTTARTLREASYQIENGGVSAAILDHLLGSVDISRLCHRLKALGIPFVIYATHEQIAADCRDGPLVPKPADPLLLVATVNALLAADQVPTRAANSITSTTP